MKPNYCKLWGISLLLLGITISSFAASPNVLPQDIETNVDPKQTIFQTFLGQDIISFTLKTELDSLMLNKKADTYYESTLSYTAVDGALHKMSVKIKPRGRSRRNYCDFPPLKIKFSKKELRGMGLREAHRSLKLVTHCSESPDAEQNVLQEYLAYKMYNLLSPNSLRVQLVRINYIDPSRSRKFTKFGILIEDIDELAERLDGKEVEGFGKEWAAFHPEEMNIFSMFQYMIGNEDWRIPFMRNVKFIQPNEGEKLIAIPYDFDASGFVSASYAKPDRDLQLSSVRQRAFMGDFKNKSSRSKAFRKFNELKNSIYALVHDFPHLDRLNRREIGEYLDGFYTIINSDALVEKALPLNGLQGEVSDEAGSFSQSR